MTRPTETQDDAGGPAHRGDETAESPHLFVVLECDRPAASGARFGLEGVGQVVIGRGPERRAWRERHDGLVTLHVQLPGRSLSRHHARLVCSRGQWQLEDLGSRNGTFVDGARVERHALPDGGAFDAGHTLLHLAPRLPTPARTPDLDAGLPTDVPAGLVTLVPLLAERSLALARAARSALPLLLRGETGTGKELVAHAAHALSGRPGRLVAVSCASLSADAGALRGADAAGGPDVLRAADGGTLFLDEVGDLSPAAQAALLRLVEDQRIRVIAATHQPLEAAVARGAFRDDLLARLSGYSHWLPPLRERLVDLGLLVAHTLARSPAARPDACLDPAVGRALWRHPWPHNGREVRQCIESALVLAGGGEVRLAHLPASIARAETSSPAAPSLAAPSAAAASHAVASPGAPSPAADDALRASLTAALQNARGNVAEVARVFGKGPTQIHRWMKRLGLDPDAFRPS